MVTARRLESRRQTEIVADNDVVVMIPQRVETLNDACA
jgi:hypothetical protein